jgi:hypothetical protein
VGFAEDFRGVLLFVIMQFDEPVDGFRLFDRFEVLAL